MIEIKQISTVYSEGFGPRIFGLGVDGDIYEWKYGVGAWQKYSTKS